MLRQLITALALAVTLMTASACSLSSGTTTTGSGRAVSEQRSVDGFNAVNVSSAIEATVMVGPDASVTVTADDNVLANVATNVFVGRLDISISGPTDVRTPVSVAITVPDLNAVQASSAAKVTVTGINTASFSAAAESSGVIVVRGNANAVSVSAKSNGSADLGGVPADSASVQLDSAGRAIVNAQRSVSGSVSSAGHLTVEGDPPVIDVSTDSGGQVVRD